MRPSKEETFLRIAQLFAKRSTCKRLNVGAVITDSEMINIIAYGYNGNYSGGPNECDSSEAGACGCIHSEINSLIKPHDNSVNQIMFVTDSPCLNCAKAIINSRRIKKIYYDREYRIKDGLELLKSAGVECVQYPLSLERN